MDLVSDLPSGSRAVPSEFQTFLTQEFASQACMQREADLQTLLRAEKQKYTKKKNWIPLQDLVQERHNSYYEFWFIVNFCLI